MAIHNSFRYLGIQVYLSGYWLHAIHDEADVFVQIDPQFLGALDDVLAIHILGETFIAHLPVHRARRNVVQAFGRPDQGHRPDKAGKLIHREKGVLQ